MPEGYALVVEREVQLEHVHARLAEEAERAAVGVLVDELEHLVLASRPRASRDPGRLDARVLGRDVRVEPGARRGHRIGRHVVTVVEAVLARGTPRSAPRPPSRKSSFVGPRFEAELDMAS